MNHLRRDRSFRCRLMLIGSAATLLSCIGCESADADEADMDPRTTFGPDSAIQLSVDEIEWQPGPDSLEEGAEYAVLEGDPGSSGIFVMRLKLPDGFEIAPHTHPNFERVTVISGTFNLGHGSTFNREEATELPAGSFTCMPPGMEHYAFAEGETVIQLTSHGPWEIHYIDPDNDPRERSE